MKGILLVPAAPPSRVRPSWGTATALQPVANRPILCHALDALHGAGVTEVLLVVPEQLAEDVEDCVGRDGPRQVDVAYRTRSTTSSRPNAMLAAVEWVDEAPCVVHRADGLLAQPLLPFAQTLVQDATDLLLLVHPHAAESDRLDSAARRLLRIADFNPARSALGIAGVGLFGPGALRRAAGAGAALEGDLDLVALAHRVAACGGRLEAQMVRRWLRYSGDAADLLDLNREMLDALAVEVDPVAGEDNQIEGRVWIHETASVTSSVIVGPAIIGAEARVASAYVGPYTSVGDGAQIEGAEVERSIICPGASILHVGGRLVASVVGSNARIFRDFSIPRAMRLRVGDGVEVALC